MKAYSIDLRQRILQDCDEGMTTRFVALKYRGSDSWVRRLKQCRHETGEVAPRRLVRKSPAKWLEYADELHACIEQQPDITLHELRAKLGRVVANLPSSDRKTKARVSTKKVCR